MRATEKHYVRFYSPGTFVSEETTVPIDAWDTRIAAEMARDITERHGARPYGFRFETRLEAGSVAVSGVEFETKSKTVRQSGTYFLGGEVRTAAEVLAGTDPKEATLRDNVRCNGFKGVVENRNSYRITLPFGEDDTLLDRDGNVVMGGIASEISTQA